MRQRTSSLCRSFRIAEFTAFALVPVVLNSAARADNWPVVRGDSYGTGVALGTITNVLDVFWTYKAGEDAGFDATAVVADGIVYIGDTAGTFHAIRLADGKAVWTKSFTDSSFGAGAAIEKDRIYVGDLNGNVRCLAVADGEEKWSVPVGAEVYAGPALNVDDVLVTCEAGALTCLKKVNGEQRWQFRIDAPLRCTPTVAAGRAMLAGCDSILHVIDVADGKELQTVEIDGPTGSTPAMSNGRVYFGTEGGTFFAIDIPETAGKKLSKAWTYRDEQRGQPIRTAAAVNEQIVVYGSQGKTIYGLDPANGNVKWKVPTRTRVESSPVIVGNRAVAATTAGKVYLLDINNGDVKWEYDAGGSFTASPAVVDGKIILGNGDGTLYCFGSKGSAKSLTAEDTESTE